jgi:Flp pilus assembly protein TadB
MSSFNLSRLWQGTSDDPAASYWSRPLNLTETVLAGCVGMTLVMFAAQVFYASWTAMLLFAPLGLLAIPWWRQKRADKRREQFLMQYQDMLYYLSSAMSAGKTTESAFAEVSRYLMAQYGGTETDLLLELKRLAAKLAMREPVERILADMAARTGLEDVRQLSEVIAIGRRSGGNLVEILQQSIRVLREKIGIRREMETAWASKKLEQRILCVSPVALIFMLRSGTDSFMAPMYETAAGRLIMTLALLLIIAGYAIGAHMMRQPDACLRQRPAQDSSPEPTGITLRGVGRMPTTDARSASYVSGILRPLLQSAGHLLASLLPARVRAFERRRLMPRVLLLRGPADAGMDFERHLADKCLHACLGMGLGVLLCLLGQAPGYLPIGLPAGGVLLWFLSDRQLETAYKQRCEQLVLEFPGFVCRVALLTGAGLHVRQALYRIVAGTSMPHAVLNREVASVLSEIEGGLPESQAWTELAERCRIREIASLCGVFMQHARLGHAGLAAELRQMASDSWDNRKHTARRLGEEASSKLMLPMAILFVAVLMVSVAPAFLSMSMAF